MRGSRTQGYGRVGQHRARGSRGYRKPGRHKAGWSYILRQEPDYFDKRGFISPVKKDVKIINLKKLDEIAIKFLAKKKAGNKQILVDLSEMGYDKLLGEGRITVPVSVKIDACSRIAQRKIEEKGGKILTREG